MSGAWNNLTMREKAGFIKIGVDNGLTSLSDIQSAYNKFAEGGAFDNKQVRKFGDGGTRVVKSIVPSETSVDPYTGDIFDEYGHRGNFSNSAFENFEIIGNQASSHEFADWLRNQIVLENQKDQAVLPISYLFPYIDNVEEVKLRQKAHKNAPSTVVEPSITVDQQGNPQIDYSVPFSIQELYETEPAKYHFYTNEAKRNIDKQELNYYSHQAPTAKNLFNGIRAGFNWLGDTWVDPSGYTVDKNGNYVYEDYPPLLGDWGKSYDILNSVAKGFSKNGDLALTPEILAEVEKQPGYSEKIAKIEGVNGKDVSAHKVMYPKSNDPMIDLTFLPFTKKYGLMSSDWGGFTKMRGKNKKGIGINGHNYLNKDDKNLTKTLVHEKRHVLEQDYKLMPYQEDVLNSVYPTEYSPIMRDRSKTISEKATTNAEVRYYLDQKGYNIDEIIDKGPTALKDVFIEENPETGEFITIFDKMQRDGYKLSGYMADYNRNIKKALEDGLLNKEGLNWGFTRAIRMVPGIAGAVAIGETLGNKEE